MQTDQGTKLCRSCDQPFFSKAWNAVYCSDACRRRYENLRHNEWVRNGRLDDLLATKGTTTRDLLSAQQGACRACRTPFPRTNNPLRPRMRYRLFLEPFTGLVCPTCASLLHLLTRRKTSLERLQAITALLIESGSGPLLEEVALKPGPRQPTLPYD